MLDAGLPVTAFFTARDGGASAAPYASLNLAFHVGDDRAAVLRNRASVEAEAGAPVAYMSQVHGAAVAVVTNADGAPEADALVTREPGLALGVLVADCVPVLIHDATAGAVAAVHAGRQGLAGGVVAAAVGRLVELGARPETMSASIGPAVCGRCYEVPEQMREDVAARVPAARATTSWGTPSLDLPGGVASQLKEAGVANIADVHVCTLEDQGYFSHRRDGGTGRFAGIVVCPGR